MAKKEKKNENLLSTTQKIKDWPKRIPKQNELGCSVEPMFYWSITQTPCNMEIVLRMRE